jgi:hypothetical protein
MKRHLCAAVGVALLALAGAGNAAADGLPIPGQTQLGSQSASYGDQTVGEQKNDADVTQSQGNGNINVSPAISIGGDASTWNAQGNGNTADATVIQVNEAGQSQRSSQGQELEQDGGSCCGGQSQAGEQTTYFGDQKVEKQENDADVSQKQGNGNVNVSPAIALGGRDGGSCTTHEKSPCREHGKGKGYGKSKPDHGGDASTWNAQGNGNTADATVIQANESGQFQHSSQGQELEQDGGSCCGGRSQTGEQKADFGDQTVEKQSNDADVAQEQGNGNINVSPAIAFGGDASTKNAQGNGNTADATVVQANQATQSQSSKQWQDLSQGGGKCCKPRHDDGKKGHHGKDDHGKKYDHGEKQHERDCCSGQSQAGEQKAYFADQKVEKQENDADVSQKQGSENVNASPALAFGGHDRGSCSKHEKSRCREHGKGKAYGKSKPDHGGDASASSAQGNGNEASASVVQANQATQSQRAAQWQGLVQKCKEVVRR